MACLETVEEHQQLGNLEMAVLGGDDTREFVRLVDCEVLGSCVRGDACYLRHQPIYREVLTVCIVYVGECRVVAHYGCFGIATEKDLRIGIYFRKELWPVTKSLPHEFSFEPRDLRGTRLSADGVRHLLETPADVD